MLDASHDQPASSAGGPGQNDQYRAPGTYCSYTYIEVDPSVSLTLPTVEDVDGLDGLALGQELRQQIRTIQFRTSRTTSIQSTVPIFSAFRRICERHWVPALYT